MRRVGVVMAVAGLLMGSTTMAVAQDATSDDGTELQHLDVPEAGVEISLPAAWNADIEMRQKEDWGLFDEGFADEPVPFWNVIYASDGSGTWCDLTWYPSHPLALDAHAERYEALMTPSHSDVERPIEVTGVELPAGEAYRFDIYNEPTAAYTTVYLLASGDAHYQLQCVGDEPAEDGWLAAAESLELAGAPEAVQDGNQPASAAAVGLERVEVPDSSLSVALPSDWTAEVGLDLSQYDMNDGSGYVRSLLAEGAADAACELRGYSLPEVPLSDYAEVVAEDHRRGGATTDVNAVELAVGDAYRVDVAGADDHASVFLWTTDIMVYEFSCASPEMRQADWSEIAASLEWLSGSRHASDAASGQDDLQRIEIPEAGVAVSFPSDFGIDLDPVAYEMSLPPDAVETTPVTTVLLGGVPDVIDCGLEVFENHPLTLEEHVAWVEQFAIAQPGFEGSVTHTAVSLPVVEALRVDGDHQAHGVWTTIYLLDHGTTRYQLYCRADQRATDDYLSIASTIELLDEQPSGEVPPGVPDDAVAWDVVESYMTEVPVAYEADGAWLMSAWCERALWLEYADGTFEERLACTLTDDPVEPPEVQGVPPAETVFFSGGECEWFSDFWYLYDGSQYWATSWSLSVEPDGTVLGVALFDAEAADCPAE